MLQLDSSCKKSQVKKHKLVTHSNIKTSHCMCISTHGIPGVQIHGYDGGGCSHEPLAASMCERSEANVDRKTSDGMTRNILTTQRRQEVY